MQRYKPLKKKKKRKNFSLLTNQLCSFLFIVTQKVQNKRREGRTSCVGYGTELVCSMGTWWGGTVSVSASSWLEGLLTVAVLCCGGGVVVVEAVLVVVLAVLVLLVVPVQLVAGMEVCSSLGCLLANSVMLKTNCRQPSLM